MQQLHSATNKIDVRLQKANKTFLNSFLSLIPNLGSKFRKKCFLRVIRVLLVNSSFSAVFTELNRRKEVSGNITFENESIYINDDLEKNLENVEKWIFGGISKFKNV